MVVKPCGPSVKTIGPTSNAISRWLREQEAAQERRDRWTLDAAIAAAVLAAIGIVVAIIIALFP